MGGVAACVPKQDCQVSLSSAVVSLQTGAGAPTHEGEVLVMREPTEAGDPRVPLVNLAHFLDKKEHCTWLQPCCSQFTPPEAASLDPGPLKEMSQQSGQEGEVYELSEDISEELKLMGMEVWLQAAMEETKDAKTCEAAVASSQSYGASRQPEEEPGAAEESEGKVASRGASRCEAIASLRAPPLDDVVEVVEATVEVSRPSNVLCPDVIEPPAEVQEVAQASDTPPTAEILEETDVQKPEPSANEDGDGDYPRLFHISALDLGDEPEEPNITPRLEGLQHVASASSNGKAKAKAKRRTRAEVMLW